MVSRRFLIAGGLFAGVPMALAPPAAHATRPPTSNGTDDNSLLLAEIRDELRALRPSCQLPRCAEIDQIRAEQRTFLRGRQKLPEFIDVGIDVWDRAYEWLVATRQPVEITRLSDGRNRLAFMMTTLVLRPDATGGFVGFGYGR